MGIFDKLRFTSKMKASWNQAREKALIDAFIDSTTCEADLIRDPKYIVNNVINDVKKINVDGVSIQSSEKLIPQDKIKDIQKSSWPGTYFYHCTNGATYKVIAGMVIDIFLNQELVDKTGLRTEEDVLRTFGKPNKIKEVRTGPVSLLRIYIYKKRHLSIEIDSEGEVARINIFK